MLSDYTIIEKIGSGGFGEVFLAIENISRRKVAIKSLKNIEEDVLEKSIHEIKIISQFYHPNIVTYHTTFQDNEVLYFVMEYCEKGSLADKIDQHPLKLNEVIKTILDIANALKFVHAKNIVHHDIKPSNILLTENDEVKLADFGVANTIGFTKLYTPPVIHSFNDFRLNKGLDIYALGISLVELLKGTHPFLNLSREEVIDKLQKGDLGISEYPDWLQEIVIKATNLKEEVRFRTIEEFAEAIESNEVALNIDQNLIIAAKKAKNLANKLYRKRYYTLKRDIEKINRKLYEYPILMEQIGRYYLAINNIYYAKRAFEIIKEKTPALNINKELGTINLELRKFPIAISLLKEQISIKPADIESYNLLLECYYKNKSFQLGYNLCKQLCDTFSNEVCFQSNLFLFDNLKEQESKLIGHNPPKHNNKFIQYNNEIFKNRYTLVSPSTIDNLFGKLLFCHYGISKAKRYNNKLEVVQKGKEIQFKKEELITIGREGYNNLFELTGKNVSRRHCILLPYENENWIYDLNSTGVYVDDIRVKGKMRLTHKHEVRIANHKITINIDKYKLF